MNKIKKLIEYLENFPSNMWWLDTCIKINENDIINIEKNIWYIFPDDFRYFLLNYNWISIPYEYIYWVTKRQHDDILINNILEHDKKNSNSMPEYLISFCPNWRWDYYCFNKKDNKIYFWQHDCIDNEFNPDFDNNTFSDWLEDNLNNSLKHLS